MKRTLIARVAGVATLALVVWFAVGLSSAQRACAHDPRFTCSPRGLSNPVRIADPLKSWAFYGHVGKGESDVYEFSLARAATIPWSLLVDSRDAGNPARPIATLENEDGALLDTIDFSRSEAFYEPFSRERYLTTPVVSLALQPGTYVIDVAMHPAARPQRYTMAIGSEERFGIAEVPYVLGAIHRIRALNY